MTSQLSGLAGCLVTKQILGSDLSKQQQWNDDSRLVGTIADADAQQQLYMPGSFNYAADGDAKCDAYLQSSQSRQGKARYKSSR